MLFKLTQQGLWYWLTKSLPTIWSYQVFTIWKCYAHIQSFDSFLLWSHMLRVIIWWISYWSWNIYIRCCSIFLLRKEVMEKFSYGTCIAKFPEPRTQLWIGEENTRGMRPSRLCFIHSIVYGNYFISVRMAFGYHNQYTGVACTIIL